MSATNWSIRQRFLAIGAVVLLGFAGVIWIGSSTLAEVRVGGANYRAIGMDKELLNEVSDPTLYLGPTMLYVFEAAATTSSETRAVALGLAEKRIAKYREKMTSWETSTVDHGLGLRDKLFRDGRAAGDELVAGLERDVLPLLKASSADAVRVSAALEALIPTFRRHRAQIEDGQKILAQRISSQQRSSEDGAEAGQRTVLWAAVGSALLALVIATVLLRSVLTSIVEVRDRLRVMAEGDADLAARIEIKARHEVGDLAHWVNQFLDKIAGLVRAVKKSTITLRSTATEMAATSHEQEATVSSFGATTTEIAAATKEISATGAELTTTMAEVDRVAKESATVAVGGRDSLAEMRGTMGALAASSTQISARLSAMNEKARDISGVVTTITKVADQTNLLSVNAAIEAEKAGEYGRGFLVVAREIRRLADQTASATLDIEQTVHQMQTAVSAGVMEMDKFSEQVRRSVAETEAVSGRLDRIIGQVQVLTDRFAHVTEGMRAQAQGAGQINEAMGGLSGSVKQTARSLGEFSAAADEMKKAVESLKQEIGRFKLED